jgi:hypothetical protein
MATTAQTPKTDTAAPVEDAFLDEGDVLLEIEHAADELRKSGEDAQITDLGASSAGINLNLDEESRSQLLAEFGRALVSLGFK